MKFTCDFYDLDSIRTSNKENSLQHNELSKEIPHQIKSFLNKDDKTCLMVLSEINRSMFDSNVVLKQSMNQIDQSFSITQNSFIDEHGNNCWQFFECKSCSNLIAFILRFTNSKRSEFLKKYLNKIILIADKDLVQI